MRACNKNHSSLHMRMCHMTRMRVRRNMMMRVTWVRRIALTMRQWRHLSATATATDHTTSATGTIALRHETLVEAIVTGLRVTEMSVSVVTVTVNELSYFWVFVRNVVAQLRFLEAGGRHSLVAGRRTAGRVRRIEARLDQLFSRLRGDHRL